MASESFSNVPGSTSSRQSASYSSRRAVAPVDRAGWVSAATSSTQASSLRARSARPAALSPSSRSSRDQLLSSWIDWILPQWRPAAALSRASALSRFARAALRHQHRALEGRDQLVALVVDVGAHLDDAAVGLRLRGPHLEHLGLARRACRRGRPGRDGVSSSVARLAIALPRCRRRTCRAPASRRAARPPRSCPAATGARTRR